MYTTTRILPTVMSISHTKLLLLIVTIFVLKTFNHDAEASTYLNTLDDLQHFYKTSYISKETGHFQFKPEKNKIYFADGYDPNWGVYRFHHVCLRGGRDGLYSGMDGVTSQAEDSEGRLSQKEWNDFIGAKFNHPLSAYNLKDSDFHAGSKPLMHHNSTIFVNCHRQHSEAYNPSKLMLKLGFLYELADCYMRNFGRHKIFKNFISLPFRQLFLHQCPNPYKSNWEWGKMVSEVVYKKLESSMVLKANHSTLLHRGVESTQDELLCFEDLYLSARADHWLQGVDHSINFRKEMAQLTGEPAEAKSIFERPMDFTSTMRQSYCPRPGSPPGNPLMTNARIKIFQRTKNSSPRTIQNLDAVIKTLQAFTQYPVTEITTTEDQPIAEQIKTFNDFDILVTTHGSHLTNGLFSMHPYTKAVIEIVPFVYDSLYYKNYMMDLGFADYVVSSGHLTPKPTIPATINSKRTTIGNGTIFCAFQQYSDFASRGCSATKISNPPKLTQGWVMCAATYHSRGCDTLVNTTILHNHLSLLLSDSLCKETSA